MSSAWAGGSTRRQRKVRLQVLIRDGYRCRIATPGEWRLQNGELRQCAVIADCVHHVRGRAVTGDDPAHMIAACTPCNLLIGEPHVDPKPRPVTQW